MSNIKRHVALVLPLALAACGVKVNGKSYGLGGTSTSSSPSPSPSASTPSSTTSSSSTSSASSSASSSSDDEPEYVKTQRERDTTCLWHPGIADPWAAVDGDHPKTITKIHSTSQEEPTVECTAANDHCMRDCSWLVTRDTEEVDNTFATYYDGDDHFKDYMGREYRAYRTVPATKRLLTPGAIVAVREFPERVGAKLQTLGRYGNFWTVGKLDRVDWKGGKVYLVGSPDPAYLSAKRVAVLRYKAGGKVEILGGRKRGDLIVRADETFAPLPEKVEVSDPWSQVKDGDPIVVADTQPFAEVPGVCKPENDHCLRPWAWLVDNNSGFAFVGKFDGKTFQAMKAIDEPTRIDGIVAAYRTVPATRANLKAGVQVFVANGTERGAHVSRWETGKVKKVRDDDKVEIETSSNNLTLPVSVLRVPVLVWWPGEKVEKL